MYVSLKTKRRIITILLILLFLLIPFSSSSANVYGCEITVYKAVLYTVVRIEVFGFVDTEFYFFPSNIDANQNFKATKDTFGDINESLYDII